MSTSIDQTNAHLIDFNNDRRLDGRDVELVRRDASLFDTAPDVFDGTTPEAKVASFASFIDGHLGAVTLDSSTGPRPEDPFLLNGHNGIYVDGSNNYFGVDGTPLQYDSATRSVEADGVYYHPQTHTITYAPDGGSASWLNTYQQNDRGEWRTPFVNLPFGGCFGGDLLPINLPSWVPAEQVPIDHLVSYQPLTDQLFVTGQISTDGRGHHFGADGTALAQIGPGHYESDGWSYMLQSNATAFINAPDGNAYHLNQENRWVRTEFVGWHAYQCEMPSELQDAMPAWIPRNGSTDVAVITAGQPVHQITDSLAADCRTNDPVGYWNQRSMHYEEMKGCVGIPGTFSSMEQFDYWTDDRLENGNYVVGNARVLSGIPIATDLEGNPTEFEDPNDSRIRWDQHGALMPQTTDLSGADLSGLDLSHQDWSDYNFTNCNFSGANLAEIDFADVDLSGVCNFSRANLERCNMLGHDLSGSTFEYAHLKDTDLLGCTLNECSFANANIDGAGLSMCKMENVNLQNSSIRNAIIGACLMEGANLNNACVIDSTIELCSFHRSTFNFCSIVESNLRSCAFGTSNFDNSFFIGKSDGSGSDLTKISCHITDAARPFYNNHPSLDGAFIESHVLREPMAWSGLADLLPLDEPLGIYPQLEGAVYGTDQDQAADRIDFIPHVRKASAVDIIGSIFVGAVGSYVGGVIGGPVLSAVLGSAASTFVSTDLSWDWEMFGKQAGVSLAANYLSPVASAYTGLNQTFCNVLITTTLNCAVEENWDDFLESFMVSLAASYAADGIDGNVDGAIENKIAATFAEHATRATLEEIINGDGFTFEALVQCIVDLAFSVIEQHQKETAIRELQELLDGKISEEDERALDHLGYTIEEIAGHIEMGASMDEILACARNGLPSIAVGDLLDAGASPRSVTTLSGIISEEGALDWMVVDGLVVLYGEGTAYAIDPYGDVVMELSDPDQMYAEIEAQGLSLGQVEAPEPPPGWPEDLVEHEAPGFLDLVLDLISVPDAEASGRGVRQLEKLCGILSRELSLPKDQRNEWRIEYCLKELNPKSNTVRDVIDTLPSAQKRIVKNAVLNAYHVAKPRPSNTGTSAATTPVVASSGGSAIERVGAISLESIVRNDTSLGLIGYAVTAEQDLMKYSPSTFSRGIATINGWVDIAQHAMSKSKTTQQNIAAAHAALKARGLIGYATDNGLLGTAINGTPLDCDTHSMVIMEALSRTGQHATLCNNGHHAWLKVGESHVDWGKVKPLDNITTLYNAITTSSDMSFWGYGVSLTNPDGQQIVSAGTRLEANLRNTAIRSDDPAAWYRLSYCYKLLGDTVNEQRCLEMRDQLMH